MPVEDLFKQDKGIYIIRGFSKKQITLRKSGEKHEIKNMSKEICEVNSNHFWVYDEDIKDFVCLKCGKIRPKDEYVYPQNND